MWPPETCCLPAEPSVGFHNRFHFGGITFTIWFRLGYFAVYASPSRLPGKAQDSLSGGAGCTFRSRTFTCKISATFHSAPLSGTKTHVKQCFLPPTPLLMAADALSSQVLPV
ncbi:hypothetical protein AXA88_26065 [Salmonella enterica]|nr:hypothetical protein [Salmonella enterica]EAX3609306.1 hypothetical protein [Salmonella enterica]EGW6282850.1 hypothetical protein [Salmonella enterica]EGX3935251.1 hypothetical protein [Salmonella enterica]